MKIKRKGYRQESREQENPTKQICYVKDSVLIFPPFTASKEGNKHQITTQRNPECKQRPCLSKLAKLSSHHSLQQSSLSCCKYILSIQNNNTNKLSFIANNGNSATDIQQYLSSFGGGGVSIFMFPRLENTRPSPSLWVSFSELRDFFGVYMHDELCLLTPNLAKTGHEFWLFMWTMHIPTS